MCGSFFLFYITMSNNTIADYGNIELLLQEKTEETKRALKWTIETQVAKLNDTKRETFNKMWGLEWSKWSTVEHFKYQASIQANLAEMKATYLEWFGEEWDYVAPIAPVEEPKKKAGRPKKK